MARGHRTTMLGQEGENDHVNTELWMVDGDPRPASPLLITNGRGAIDSGALLNLQAVSLVSITRVA